MKIWMHPSAEAEIDESVDFYEKREYLLGKRFLIDFTRALEAIRSKPELWPKKRHGCRRYVMQSFPFAIWYDIRESQVVVVALAHGSRDPGYWKSRVKDLR